jgi:predicted ATPase
MSHKLKRIFVEGFKSIKTLDIAINDLNVLIGANGAGKSNFIGLFKFLREIIETRLQIYTGINGGANKILHFGSKVTKNLHIALDFSPNYYEINLLPSTNDSFIFKYEICYFDTNSSTNKRYRENINNGGSESKLESESKKINWATVPKHVLNVLKDWRLYHFHDTSPDARVKKSGNILDSDYLKGDASNLAAFLYSMKNNNQKHYDRIVDTIQLIVPYFKDFVFRTNPVNSGSIFLEWQDKNSDMVFNANDLSDGSLRFICLATLLLQPILPSLILLDEPELGLHPSAITMLGALIKKASIKSQVIISTQSVNLVNEFEPKDIIVVENKDGQSSFNRLDNENLDSWLENYSIGELWEQNVLGGKP